MVFQPSFSGAHLHVKKSQSHSPICTTLEDFLVYLFEPKKQPFCYLSKLLKAEGYEVSCFQFPFHEHRDCEILLVFPADLSGELKITKKRQSVVKWYRPSRGPGVFVRYLESDSFGIFFYSCLAKCGILKSTYLMDTRTPCDSHCTPGILTKLGCLNLLSTKTCWFSHI